MIKNGSTALNIAIFYYKIVYFGKLELLFCLLIDMSNIIHCHFDYCLKFVL